MSLESWKKFYSWFPDDFWQDGGKYKYDEIEESLIYYQSDEHWHWWYRIVEYEFRGDKLFLVELSHFECGDTEFHDEHEVPEDPGHLESYLSASYQALCLERQIEYAEWVMENRKDPLHEYLFGVPTKKQLKNSIPRLKKDREYYLAEMRAHERD